MCLVDHHHIPVDFNQPVESIGYSLETSNQHIEVPFLDVLLVGLGSLFFCSEEEDTVEGGQPFVEFVLPVVEGSEGSDY